MMKIEVGSALSAQIKQSQGAGAGVGADDGAHIVDADVLGAEALPTIWATASASSRQSPWLMKTVCFPRPVTVFSILSTRAFREDCRPLALPVLMRCPSSSTWSTGLIWSMEPTTAVVAEMRPPRLRKCRSSTVNWWQRESLLASAQSRTSSMVRLFFRSWAAYHTSSPWPREAHRVSTVYSFRPGTSHSAPPPPAWRTGRWPTDRRRKPVPARPGQPGAGARWPPHTGSC